MNLSSLRSYARGARRDFLAAVTAQMQLLGLYPDGTAPSKIRGDALLVGPHVLPAAAAQPRQQLAERIASQGYATVVDEMAYTWFNRLVALRFMELHGYLGHGYRVLSHRNDDQEPEIMHHVQDVQLPGLDRSRALHMKLDGGREEELYRMLLLAQCNALHRAIPQLFDRVQAASALLLPANLLHSDSVIRRLVQDVHEEAWQDIKVVGWLYQFYISERKDEVMGTVVASEDIPAATQLFTPDWIVQYLVQNSLGALWIGADRRSALLEQMPFHERTVDPTQDTGLPPPHTYITHITDLEAVTILDPACGSGHILLEAYDLLRAIYLERGYRPRDLAQLILEKNLFGLDIDRRAAQLTTFCLMMKGRADDPKLLAKRPRLNILPLTGSESLKGALASDATTRKVFGKAHQHALDLAKLFEHGATAGSLLSVPTDLAEQLPHLERTAARLLQRGDMFRTQTARLVLRLVRQAMLLHRQYDVVVANPPYMGSNAMNAILKAYVRKAFPAAKKDLFSCFIERCCQMTKPEGFAALVTMHNWMFIASFEEMRRHLLRTRTIRVLAHLGPKAFESIGGEVVQTAAFVLQNAPPRDHTPAFARLVDGKAADKRQALLRGEHRYRNIAQHQFELIPGCPVAYWLGSKVYDLYAQSPLMKDVVHARIGLTTGDNNRFLRRWWEVDVARIGFGMHSQAETVRSGLKWFPLNKGGGFRRWFGNLEYVINWEDGAREIRQEHSGRRAPNHYAVPDTYFQPTLSWTDVGTGPKGFRMYDEGFIHNNVGHSVTGNTAVSRALLAGFCNTPVVDSLAEAINPTLHFGIRDFGRLPAPPSVPDALQGIVERHVRTLVAISRADWNAYETAWDFEVNPLIRLKQGGSSESLEACLQIWEAECRRAFQTTRALEEGNNRRFIELCGLTGTMRPGVPEDRITLMGNPAYRYRNKTSRFRRDAMAELLSYALGCMMGRYSLDEAGLVYAAAKGVGFDRTRYRTFPADDDGIVPVTPDPWFEDDLLVRLEEFLRVVWGPKELEAGLSFMADHLASSGQGSSRTKLRSFAQQKFYAHHLKMYRKRPIYWLITSGPARAFQCFVYLHRYHAGTLARVRTRYVIPLQGILATRLRRLDEDIRNADTQHRSARLTTQKAAIAKQNLELRQFDDLLRSYADRAQPLDLDDGIRDNYAVFSPLLARL